MIQLVSAWHLDTKRHWSPTRPLTVTMGPDVITEVAPSVTSLTNVIIGVSAVVVMGVIVVGDSVAGADPAAAVVVVAVALAGAVPVEVARVEAAVAGIAIAGRHRRAVAARQAEAVHVKVAATAMLAIAV